MSDVADQHQIPLKTLYSRVESSPEGVTTDEASIRLKRFGSNFLEADNHDPLWLTFLKQFINFFALLLLGGAGLALFAEKLDPGQGNLYIGYALAGVVILNAIFTFIQQYQSEKIMDSFRKMLPTAVKVLRDGNEQEIIAEQLVPGDIIFLEEGNKVPADARLIEQNAMKVDNSSLTGESEPQLRKIECTHKNILESRNMVFSGTLIQSGNGKALIYATGMQTQIGQIVKLTKGTQSAETPLHTELHRFIRIISTIAISLGVVFFFVSLLLGKQFLGSVIFAIGIIVANVPEGLLPTVTLALSMAAKRMAKKKALIKNLESVETLGSTTVICTDKTGTLTQNKMTVRGIMIGLQDTLINEKNFELVEHTEHFFGSMVLCNNARYDTERKRFIGDPTETALIDFAEKFGNMQRFIEDFPRLHESPFDSETKRMITTNDVGGKYIAYMKGAPEMVLEKCAYIVDGHHAGANMDVRLDEIAKKRIMEMYENMAAQGERVLALAYKATSTLKTKEEKFILLGLVSMVDPPRPEVPKAIKQCHTAGIRVIMVTGDYSTTAQAIAKQVGLVPEGVSATIVTGEQLTKMSNDELQKTLQKKYLIFARTNPRQKLKIVQALQQQDEVVTVTGDGVNDAPALKNADMGVSMGIGGTEVAREASDMVLMDDNFSTIVTAIKEGRTIFENIKKFIAYILTSNIPEILPFIAFALFTIPLPLTVILILCIDLGTDIIPALGLATEKPENDIMKKPPRPRTERLLTMKLLGMSYGIIGMIQAAAGFFSFFFVLFHGGWQWGQELTFDDPLYLRAVTVFFVSIIICQIADVYICRTRRQSVFSVGFFGNKLILLGILTELILLSIIVYFPATHSFFGTHPLSWWELTLSIPFALLIFFGDELRKYFLRKGNTFVERWLTW